jgi:serine/threonine protein kinase
MVLDFMETDLHKIIYSRNELTDEHIQYFTYQMLRALKYIHSAHVIHRDLKPSNLLLNGNCDLKICDFGLARGVKEEEDYELTEYVVTRWYRAPEVMCSCQEYDHKIDVWSVGCILGELHGRKPLFPGDDYIKQMNLIFNVLGTPSKADMSFISNDKALDYIKSLEKRPKVPFNKIYPDANPLALDLMDKMLAFSPLKRISVDEALKHPYLAGLHNPKKEFECKDRFDFDFEKIEMTKEVLQDFMWEEIYMFRPERRIKGAPKKTDKHFALAEKKRKEKEEAKKRRTTAGGKRSTATSNAMLAAVQSNQNQAAQAQQQVTTGSTSGPKMNSELGLNASFNAPPRL